MYPDGALPSPSPEGYHGYRWCCHGYGHAVARGVRFAVAHQSRLHRLNNQDELALQVKATAVPPQISCAFCFACTACHLLQWTHYPILVHSSKSAESFGPNAPHDTTNAISPAGPVLISKFKTIAVLLKASYSLKKSLTGCPLRQQKTICARTWENQLAVATFKKKRIGSDCTRSAAGLTRHFWAQSPQQKQRHIWKGHAPCMPPPTATLITRLHSATSVTNMSPCW